MFIYVLLEIIIEILLDINMPRLRSINIETYHRNKRHQKIVDHRRPKRSTFTDSITIYSIPKAGRDRLKNGGVRRISTLSGGLVRTASTREKVHCRARDYAASNRIDPGGTAHVCPERIDIWMSGSSHRCKK